MKETDENKQELDTDFGFTEDQSAELRAEGIDDWKEYDSYSEALSDVDYEGLGDDGRDEDTHDDNEDTEKQNEHEESDSIQAENDQELDTDSGLTEEQSAELRSEGLDEWKEYDNYSEALSDIDYDDLENDVVEDVEESIEDTATDENEDSSEENEPVVEAKDIPSIPDVDGWEREMAQDHVESGNQDADDIHRVADQSDRPEMERGKNKGLDR